ncbi:competence protein CoiA family protein [Pseudidiomarina salilacus]|uniref:competence protein CoiA family protein n=2 Tax=Pseudidiomarina salilacus TaxID=3384452 RepID=UPI0039847FB4
MSYSLIPFAIQKSSGRWVDVTQVERGLKCDCICPACFADVVAKKGDLQDWHFAHRASDNDEGCLHAFAESLYGSTMQILNQLSCIMVPYASLFESRTLNIQDIELDVEFDEYSADFVVYSQDTQIAVILTHELRPFHGELLTLIPRSYPILEIQLNEFRCDFQNVEPHEYQQLLLRLFSESLTAKRWRRTPEKCDFPSREQFIYNCMGCGSRWQSHALAHMCEVCQTPLLSMRDPVS